MYAIISCSGCNRYRMIDRSSLNSKCPFCGVDDEHRYRTIIYEDKDQKTVRDALAHVSGFVPEAKENHIGEVDPLSTLIYRYEHCSGIDEKMELLAKGLTEIHGTFTLDDVLEIDPRFGERLLDSMLEACLVAEVKPGKYRA